jgi:hypothetical protein
MHAQRGEVPAVRPADATLRNLGERAWWELGSRLAQQRAEIAGQGSQHMWDVGDWLVAGEDDVFRRMKRVKVRELAADITGYSQRTLKMAVSVARRIDPDVRVAGLSWWHHLLVACLDRDGQVDWLTRAAEEGWSAARLRDELRGAGMIARPRSRTHVQRLVTQVVKLSREEIPDQMVEQLAYWWSGLQPEVRTVQ